MLKAEKRKAESRKGNKKRREKMKKEKVVKVIDLEMNRDGYFFAKKIDGFVEISKDKMNWEIISDGTHYFSVCNRYF
jgi:hypothetical protein